MNKIKIFRLFYNCKVNRSHICNSQQGHAGRECGSPRNCRYKSKMKKEEITEFIIKK
jgi:hypothetical protein